MKGSSGVASGVVMVLAGAFLVLRTVRRPEGGRNLVDLILGGNAQAEAAANAQAAGKANELLSLPSLTQRPRAASPVKPRTSNGAAGKSIRDSAGSR